MRLAGLPAAARGEVQPLQLVQLQDPEESIYEDVGPPRPEEGFNSGGVNFDLTVSYLTDYVFRGVDQSELGENEDAPNLQFDGFFKFDLGKLPHPIAGVFVNIYEDDPVSEFQEIRPYVGFQWESGRSRSPAGTRRSSSPSARPSTRTRSTSASRSTTRRIWGTDQPLLSPYGFAAYDYDLYHGVYVEVGLSHEFTLEGTGITFVAQADLAYVTGHPFFADPEAADPSENGFQHYDVGLTGTYSLNSLLNIPRPLRPVEPQRLPLLHRRHRERPPAPDTQLWGGMGVRFQY